MPKQRHSGLLNAISRTMTKSHPYIPTFTRCVCFMFYIAMCSEHVHYSLSLHSRQLVAPITVDSQHINSRSILGLAPPRCFQLVEHRVYLCNEASKHRMDQPSVSG